MEKDGKRDLIEGVEKNKSKRTLIDEENFEFVRTSDFFRKFKDFFRFSLTSVLFSVFDFEIWATIDSSTTCTVPGIQYSRIRKKSFGYNALIGVGKVDRTTFLTVAPAKKNQQVKKNSMEELLSVGNTSPSGKTSRFTREE